MPLVTSGGQAIGSFCAIDFKPRAWIPLDIDVMQELAVSTLREIELRNALATLDDEQRRLKVLLQHIPIGVVFSEAPSDEVVLRNRQAREVLGEQQFGLAQWTGYRADGSTIAVDEWPIARALRGEVVRNEEILSERPDGHRVWLRNRAC